VWRTALVVVLVDQVTKACAVTFLENQNPVNIIGHWLQLSFARNPGAAFSFGTHATVIFTVLAAGASVFIVRLAPRVAHKNWAIVFGLILGGAVGNLIDRIVRTPGIFRGHVVDFIALPNYPLFNVADSAITCAAIAGIYLTIRGIAPLTAKIES
jgi:signal peptidase II